MQHGSVTDLDAVVLLAGGLTYDGAQPPLPPWVTRRLDACANLQRQQARPCPILLLGT